MQQGPVFFRYIQYFVSISDSKSLTVLEPNGIEPYFRSAVIALYLNMRLFRRITRLEVGGDDRLPLA